MKSIELKGGPHAVLALHGLLGNPLEMQFVGKKLQREDGFSSPRVTSDEDGSSFWKASLDQRIKARDASRNAIYLRHKFCFSESPTAYGSW